MTVCFLPIIQIFVTAAFSKNSNNGTSSLYTRICPLWVPIINCKLIYTCKRCTYIYLLLVNQITSFLPSLLTSISASDFTWPLARIQNVSAPLWLNARTQSVWKYVLLSLANSTCHCIYHFRLITPMGMCVTHRCRWESARLLRVFHYRTSLCCRPHCKLQKPI